MLRVCTGLWMHKVPPIVDLVVHIALGKPWINFVRHVLRPFCPGISLVCIVFLVCKSRCAVVVNGLDLS